jgi:hypothetical protein
MNWTERTLEKARSVHSEIAELRRFLAEQGGDPDHLRHLFDGHYAALDDMYLDRMPIAVALDQSDLVLQYHGEEIQKRSCPFTRMHRIINNIHKELVHVAKTHSNYAGGTRTRWRGDVDLRVTASDPRLIFGFKLPAANGDPDRPHLLNFEDPIYVAVKESMELVGVVSASLHDEKPRERIMDFAKGKPTIDVALIDAALHAARRLIPQKEKGIDSVEVGGLAIPSGLAVDLGKDEWTRATQALAETRIPKDEADVIGNLMAVDYETMRFEIRDIVDWEIRSVRCQYGPEHEYFVKTHGKTRIKVHGRADFDRNHNPRFMVVETMTPIT